MSNQKTINGLSCADVLSLLPDYLDGTLEADVLEKVKGHLNACDWCERFGGDYAATVRSIRKHLKTEPRRSPDASRRLRRLLDKALD